MTGKPRPRSNQRRRPAPKRARPIDVWRSVGELPEVAHIAIPDDVSALLRSLGDPPMNGANAGGGYFIAVAERAAAVARGLAISVDLLAESPED